MTPAAQRLWQTLFAVKAEGLSATDTDKLQSVIVNARNIRRGETLFRIGDTFDALYAIRSGSLKTVVTSANGRDQVMGLHLGGDALGLYAFRRK